jgi:hypothetical protein
MGSVEVPDSRGWRHTALRERPHLPASDQNLTLDTVLEGLLTVHSGSAGSQLCAESDQPLNVTVGGDYRPRR